MEEMGDKPLRDDQTPVQDPQPQPVQPIQELEPPLRITTTTSPLITLEAENELLAFTFSALPPPDFSQTLREKLEQWGMSKHLKIGRFRYNKTYTDLNSTDFLNDLLKSADFRNSGFGVPMPKDTTGYTKLRVTHMNMNLLDKLEEHDIVGHGDYIKKTWGETVDGVEIVDKLREALLCPDTEAAQAFSQKDREELLFLVLQLVVVGGSLNQYEDYLGPYRDAVRELYKALVSVRKDANTSQMFIDTFAYRITKVDGKDIFAEEHPQNMVIVCVQNFSKTAVVLRFKWEYFA